MGDGREGVKRALQPPAGAEGTLPSSHPAAGKQELEGMELETTPDVPAFSHKVMAERVEKGVMEKGEI